MNYYSPFEHLKVINPWWDAGNFILPHRAIQRYIFFDLVKWLKEKEILGLIGLRRAGKTFLMWQLIQYLLSQNVNPKTIIYFDCDDPTIFNNNHFIDDLINYYTKNIHSISLKETEVYFFLDEIQNIKDWSWQLKKQYDIIGTKAKFIISGSSSSLILSKGTQSLVGRLIPKVVSPFSLSEVSSAFINGNEIDSLRNDSLINNLFSFSFDKNYQFFTDSFKIVEKRMNEFQNVFEKYIRFGGLPEVILSNELDSALKRAKSWIYLTLHRDIITTFNIEYPDKLESLLIYLAKESGQTHTPTNLSKLLRLKINVVNEYLGYLQFVFLIIVNKLYTLSSGKKLRKPNKIYFCDTGLRNSLTFIDTDGLLVETAVAIHLENLVRQGNLAFSNYYWHNGQEVDFILSYFDKTVPIEVKYQNKITDDDTLGIRKFIESNNAEWGIILTKNDIGIKENIILLPVWLFLLMC